MQSHHHLVAFKFARHERALTGAGTEHAQIVGSVWHNSHNSFFLSEYIHFTTKKLRFTQ